MSGFSFRCINMSGATREGGRAASQIARGINEHFGGHSPPYKSNSASYSSVDKRHNRGVRSFLLTYLKNPSLTVKDNS